MNSNPLTRLLYIYKHSKCLLETNDAIRNACGFFQLLLEVSRFSEAVSVTLDVLLS